MGVWKRDIDMNEWVNYTIIIVSVYYETFDESVE